MFSVAIFYLNAQPVKIPVVPIASRSRAKKVALQSLEPHYFRTVRVRNWIVWRRLRRGVRVCISAVLPAPPDPVFVAYDQYLNFLSTFHHERGLSFENVLTYLWETDQVMSFECFSVVHQEQKREPFIYIRTEAEQEADLDEFWKEVQWHKF